MPRRSASAISAKPMVRTVGRVRIDSAPMRTWTCAMVVPPAKSGREAGRGSSIGHAVAATWVKSTPQDGLVRTLATILHPNEPFGTEVIPVALSQRRERQGGRPCVVMLLADQKPPPATSMLALAVGAAAFGAVAVGAG